VLYGDRFALDGEAAHHEASLACAAATEALGFCAHAIAYLRDPALLELALQISDVFTGMDDFDLVDPYSAIRELAATGRVTAQMAQLLDHDCEGLRDALAEGLRPDMAESAALLRRLCDDPDARVRASAVKRLGTFAPVAWWSGAFSADPTQGLTPEEAALHLPVLQELATHLASPHYDSKRVEHILGVAEKLPAAPGADAVGRVLEAVGGYETKVKQRGGRRLAGAGEAGKAVLQRLERSKPESLGDVIPAYVEALSPTERQATLLGWLDGLKTPMVSDHYLDKSAESARAHAIALHWSERADPRPLLDAALARARSANPQSWDGVVAQLGRALGERGALEVLEPLLVPQLLLGFPPPWREIERGCQQALARLPRARLAKVVEQALRCPAQSTVIWALEQRLDVLYERKRDGTRRALVERLDDDPGLRNALRGGLTIRLIPRLRRELIEGSLGLPHGLRLLLEVGQIYGGICDFCVFMAGEVTELPPPRLRDDLRKQAASFLGPRAGQLPPTAAEQQAIRALRDAHPLEDEASIFVALQVLPRQAPLHAEDRAFVERATALAPKLASPRILLQLGWVLVCCGDQRDLATLKHLEHLTRALDDDDDDFALNELRKYQTVLARRSGPPGRQPLQLVRKPAAGT
jgi:hypothetical protein